MFTGGLPVPPTRSDEYAYHEESHLEIVRIHCTLSYCNSHETRSRRYNLIEAKVYEYSDGNAKNNQRKGRIWRDKRAMIDSARNKISVPTEDEKHYRKRSTVMKI